MAGTFCKALQALVFIDFYGQPQGGDLQPSQTAILIKKAIRQGELVTAQAGILRRRAVIISPSVADPVPEPPHWESTPGPKRYPDSA